MARIVVFIAFLALANMGCKAQRLVEATKPDTATVANAKADSLVTFAKGLLGVPYRYGGTDPQGFDCSGYVNYVFKKNGMDLPRSSPELAKVGKEIPLSQCRKGDIILFAGSSPSKNPIGHAGIIISELGEPIKFIHSATSNRQGIVITALDQYEYYLKRFVKVVRVLTGNEDDK